MRKGLVLLFCCVCVAIFSQEKKCLIEIRKKRPDRANIFIDYDDIRNEVTYDFRNRFFYNSKVPICASEMLYKNDLATISAFKFQLGSKTYYGDARDFVLKDSIYVKKRYPILFADSIQYYRTAALEIQKNNYEKYLSERRNLLVKKYGASAANKILNGDTWIGMSKSMLLESLGENYTVTGSLEDAGGYTVGYRYGSERIGTTYYLRNGKVVTIIEY